MADGQPRVRTRIQARNRAVILAAALKVFADHGRRGATLDMIGEEAGLSKPNILYYFAGKEAIYEDLLTGLLDTWLDPLRALDPGGDPMTEILGYVRAKLDLSRRLPLESRLFATEIVQGAPLIGTNLRGELRELVADRAKVIEGWAEAGRIAPVDGRHLIMSIWALTQHYADFGVQVAAVLDDADPWDAAAMHLDTLFTRMLQV
ncbi:TetR family transcriptional regulator [Salipiger sp. IMCC34102]|uniref:TetR family transcriptional regulator C-terminal domain-containing protein n=1 Tax=Salipiger sp. IMCC34102 TaxID=2510647 RepID=UPI00101BBDE9|nr:TetR family transcriptional regulator C-terminal domain-containing protein [Salipiger sp. IMCC34102]RYH04524.1 TetR family transcriptional regulator [Salipiger sp. IMCC34102]